MHPDEVPVMVVGKELMVTVAWALQPVEGVV
jgi:hypothetical protein